MKDYEAAIKISPESKKLSKGLKESQAALKKSQVTELAEKLVQAHGRESRVEDVSDDRLGKMRVKRRRCRR